MNPNTNTSLDQWAMNIANVIFIAAILVGIGALVWAVWASAVLILPMKVFATAALAAFSAIAFGAAVVAGRRP